MKKAAAVAISIGVILVIAGLVMVGIFGGEAIRNTDWKSIFSGTTHNLENAKESIDKTSEELQGLEYIRVFTDHYTVYVLPTNENIVSVKYVEEEQDVRINMDFTSKTLTIKEEDNLSKNFWSDRFNPNRFIVVYLPQTEMFTNADLDILAQTAGVVVRNIKLASFSGKAYTGSVSLYQSDIGDAKLTAQTGSVTVEHLSCNKTEIVTETGSVNMTDVVAQDSVKIKVNTGSVNCRVVANNLKAEIDTGSMTFNVKADYINVTTDTGSINGKVRGDKKDYQITVRKDTGKSNISNQTVVGATKFLNVEVDTGSINVDFIND